jgi:hypothetical protein
MGDKMDERAPREPNSFLEMLENLGIEDPRLRMIAEMMAKQSAPQSGQPSPEETLAKKRRTLARIETLIQENSELQQENQVLHERLALLAEALGACPHCWGEDNSCRICYGQGTPGSFIPNREVFAAYVLPAVRTISRYRLRNKAPGAGKERDQAISENPQGD